MSQDTRPARRTHGDRRTPGAGSDPRALPDADLARLAFAPEEVLGPFSGLSAGDREALRSGIEAYDAALMRGYEGRAGRWHGRLLRLVSRAAVRAAREGSARTVGRPLSRGLRLLMSALRRAPEFAGAAAYRTHRALASRLPGRGDGAVRRLLARPALAPHALAVVYARPLAQRARFRAFWRDPDAHRTVGCILGLDLCPSAQGWHVIESNLEPAQRPDRVQLYERDEFAVKLVEHAAAGGYRELVVLDSRFSGVLPAIAEQYRAEAAAAGIRLRLVDRIFVPRTSNERSFGLPPDLPRDTLLVRLKSYPVATDYLLQDKIGSYRALSRYADVADEPDLRVPAAGPEPVLADHGPETPFPNVVVKQADVDKGRAVRFAKAESPEHARELLGRDAGAPEGLLLRERLQNMVREPRLVFQEYVRPRLLEGRRPYKVRAHVLVSPDGPVFLSAHRIVSSRSVPERLPVGLVENKKLFTVSFSGGGGHYERVPPEELPAVRRATLAAGRGFAWALRESFVWRPQQEEAATS